MGCGWGGGVGVKILYHNIRDGGERGRGGGAGSKYYTIF